MKKKHPYKEIVLPNKLKVLHYQMKSVMSMFALLYVKVGSVYESKNKSGISHFTEHLSFLGTNKYPSPLAISQATENMGARKNGHTRSFSTRYWINLPYTNTEKGIDLLHQLVSEPLLKNDDIQKEKNVIISEFDDFWHNPDRRFEYENWKRRFKQKEHPYSQIILGVPETIKSLGKTDFLSWRKKYYSPANMLLVVAGNIDEKNLRNTIEKNFGKNTPGSKAEKPKPPNKAYSGFSIYHQKEPRPQIRFLVSFPLFGWKEVQRQKRVQMNMLNHIFGRGSASRLFQRLREKEGFAYRIGSAFDTYSWMGVFTIWGSVSVEKLLPSMKVLKEEIDKLVKGGVTEKEINLSRNYLSASNLMHFDNPVSIAYYLGSQVIDEEELWFPEDYIREFNKVTKKDLDQLAKEMIDYSKVNISLLGNIPQKKIKEVEEIFRRKRTGTSLSRASEDEEK